jgi:hypothetical protein
VTLKAVGPLADALRSNSTLCELNLAGNLFGGEGTGLLAESLKTCQERMRPREDSEVNGLTVAVAVSQDNTQDDSILESKMGPLHTLSKGKSGIQHVLMGGSVCGLQLLDLSENDTGPQGSGLIFGALKLNKTLTHLELRYAIMCLVYAIVCLVVGFGSCAVDSC